MLLHPDDRPLAEQLAAAETAAVTELAGRFAAQLSHAHADLLGRAPGCRLVLADALPHLARAVGEGYLRSPGRSGLAGYFENLHLTDMMQVAACLDNDAAAWRRLQEVIDAQVAPSLRRRWAFRASPEAVDRVIADLAGHCFQSASKGPQAGRQRLASYLGWASLPAWLQAAATRVLQVDLRHHSEQPSMPDGTDWAVTGASSRPDVALLMRDAESRGTAYFRRLVQALRQVLDGMPTRRRLAAVLHWGHGERPAQIAEFMRVSRPRVTELLGEARLQFQTAAAATCREIAGASGRSVQEVQALLDLELGRFLNTGPPEQPAQAGVEGTPHPGTSAASMGGGMEADEDSGSTGREKP